MMCLIDVIGMKVKLEMNIEEDGTTVLYKFSELANKAKELGFIAIEAEIKSEDQKMKKKRKEVRKSSLNDVKIHGQNFDYPQKQAEGPAARKAISEYKMRVKVNGRRE
jgi:hypothetical protein